jgi:hypothetical protein
VTGRRGRRGKQLLDDIKENKGYCGHIFHMNCLLQQFTEGKIQNEDISEGKTRKKK